MSINPNAVPCVNTLMHLGWAREHACGAVGNGVVESSLNPHAVGDHGEARGCFQWHEDRQAAIHRATGIDVRTADLEGQMKALDWEIRHTQPEAFAAVSNTTTAYAAGYAFCQYFERPANVHAQAMARGHIADEIFRAMA